MDITNGRTLLIIGGARSGKSAYGETIARASALELHYVATASAGDTEMAARIAAHKARRGDNWFTHEAGTDICQALDSHGGNGTVMLIDCLTLWLSNLMAVSADIKAQTQALIAGFDRAEGAIIVVTGEVGGGIVPATPLARTFRDAQGRLNQRIAEAADNVVLVTAGLPLALKTDGKPAHE